MDNDEAMAIEGRLVLLAIFFGGLAHSSSPLKFLSLFGILN
jgi:hypothetical protein